MKPHNPSHPVGAWGLTSVKKESDRLAGRQAMEHLLLSPPVASVACPARRTSDSFSRHTPDGDTKRGFNLLD